MVQYALIETPSSWTELDPADHPNFSIDGVTAKHSGLDAGRTYRYQVAAYNKMMKNADGKTVYDPNYLSPLIADTDTELTINLVWTAPPDPAGAPVLGYVVQYALIETPSSWTELDPADHPNFSIDGVTAKHSGLDAGRTYRYQVAAYNKMMKNADGKTVYDPNYLSPWASPDSATTLTGAAPGAVENVRGGVSPSVPKIFLHWSPPDDPMGDPVNAYLVRGRPISQPDGEPLVEAEDPLCDPDLTTAGSDIACPWETIKDNIGRPSGEFINEFEVTSRDVDNNTRYDAYFTTTANWEYHIAAKNRAMANITDDPADDSITVTRHGGNDPEQFLKLPESLRVLPSEAAADNEGRTGLTLTWNKSQTVQAEAARTDASHYRVEYSNTGRSDPGGYNWRLLGATTLVASQLTDGVADASQTSTDNAETVHLEADLTTDEDADENLRAGQTRYYRVFALSGATSLMSFQSDQKSGTTAHPNKPNPPTSPTAIPDSHTSIKLSWIAPDGGDTPNDELDGSEEGPSVIVGYYIQYLDEGATGWAHITTKDGSKLITDGKTPPATMYVDKGLAPGASREYRMAAVNKISTSDQRSDWTDLVKGSTVPIPFPNEASGLVVEATGRTTIDLTWLAQAERPEDALVTEYVIEHSPDGKAGTFMTLATVSAKTPDPDGDVHTIYTDDTLSPGTERHYRVYAKNPRGLSDQVSNVAMATTDPAEMPGMPMNVMATATSDTEITVTWGSPADNGGADITGYMVERGVMGADSMMTWTAVDPAHSGMMMEYMDTGLMPLTKYYYRVSATNSAGTGDPSDGMAYAMTNTSNTAPMAVGSISPVTVTSGAMSAAIDLGDHFSDADGDALTYSTPTSSDSAVATATITHTLDAASPNADVRIYTLTIAGHMAGSATITVTAMDAAGEMATQDIMVTVEAANTAPMAGDAIADQTVTAGGTVMVQSTITDADADDTLTWSAASDMEMYATATVDTMGMVTITGVAAGMATITVTATDAAGAYAMQTIMVTVTSTELTAPTGLVVSSLANTQSISVTWDPNSIQNAEQIKVALFNSAVTELAAGLITINPANDDGSATFNDVDDGDYIVVVASFRSGEAHKISDLKPVTVE